MSPIQPVSGLMEKKGKYTEMLNGIMAKSQSMVEKQEESIIYMKRSTKLAAALIVVVALQCCMNFAFTLYANELSKKMHVASGTSRDMDGQISIDATRCSTRTMLSPSPYLGAKSGGVAGSIQRRAYHVFNLEELLDQFNAVPIIAALIRKGLPDALGEDEEASIEDLAARTSVQAKDNLYGLMTYASKFGVFEQVDGTRLFRHSLDSLGLRGRSTMALRSMWRSSKHNLISMIHAEKLFDDDSKAAYEQVTGSNYFKDLQEEPFEEKIFHDYLSSLTATVHAAMRDQYDWGQFGTLSDVAGGHGACIKTILPKFPNVHGIVGDLEQTTKAGIVPEGMNLEFLTIDLFTDLGYNADGFILKWILHDWKDEEAVQIMSTVKKAGNPGFKLMVVELARTDTVNMFTESARHDINMRLLPGGRERTVAQYVELGVRAGLEHTGLTLSLGPMVGIEFQAAS